MWDRHLFKHVYGTCAVSHYVWLCSASLKSLLVSLCVWTFIEVFYSPRCYFPFNNTNKWRRKRERSNNKGQLQRNDRTYKYSQCNHLALKCVSYCSNLYWDKKSTHTHTQSYTAPCVLLTKFEITAMPSAKSNATDHFMLKRNCTFYSTIKRPLTWTTKFNLSKSCAC